MKIKIISDLKGNVRSLIITFLISIVSFILSVFFFYLSSKWSDKFEYLGNVCVVIATLSLFYGVGSLVFILIKFLIYRVVGKNSG